VFSDLWLSLFGEVACHAFKYLGGREIMEMNLLRTAVGFYRSLMEGGGGNNVVVDG